MSGTCADLDASGSQWARSQFTTNCRINKGTIAFQNLPRNRMPAAAYETQNKPVSVTAAPKRTGDWNLPLSYFAFWTVRLGGWLPRFDRCAGCDAPLGSKPAFYDAHQPGLFCEKCRRSGMKPLRHEARLLAERFAGERLDRIEFEKSMQPIAGELREASLTWIEHNLERRLITRELLEQT